MNELEMLANKIFQDLKIVWDGNDFVKVDKFKFKEVNPITIQTKLLKFDSLVIDNMKEIKSILYRRYRTTQEEFEQNKIMEYEGPIDFVMKEGIEKGLFTVQANGTYTGGGEEKAIIQRLKLKANDYNNSIGSKELTADLIRAAFDVVVEEKKIEKLNKMRKELAYDSNVKADWHELLRMMRIKTSHEDFEDLTEKHIKILKHMVWQVKRKLYLQPVKYHLCLILYGKQGCGKSDFLRQFFAPLEEVYCLLDGNKLEDSFSNGIWESHFVGNLDELSKVKEKSIELVKQFITSTKNTGRVMFSQVHENSKQNMTLVGSTNRPLNQVIYKDYTGMRRWWQMEINKAFDHMDFEAIEAEDFMSFWKSVDENGVGYYNQEEDMLAYQNTFKAINIDHCHDSGKIRGLLCHQCNSGLGMFKDNINNLKMQ